MRQSSETLNTCSLPGVATGTLLMRVASTQSSTMNLPCGDRFGPGKAQGWYAMGSGLPTFHGRPEGDFAAWPG